MKPTRETAATSGSKSGGVRLRFHVSLLYNLCRQSTHTRPWWTRIEPFVVLGALPYHQQHHLERLTIEENVRAVVTMNQPEELLKNAFITPVTPDDWANAGVAQFFGCTKDFTAPSLETIERCVDFIAEHVAQEHSVYVHCKAGRGRSTVVVAAYLIRHRGMTVNESIAFIRARRSHVSLHPKQKYILANFAARMQANARDRDECGDQ